MCKAVPFEERKLLPTPVATSDEHEHWRRDSTSDSSGTTSSSRDENQPRRANHKHRRHRANRRTKKRQQEEQAHNIVALDCEMVGVGPNGRQSALARVAMVDWDGQVIYDAYIKPDCEVTDYRTYVSGIAEEHLKDGISFGECREQVQEILNGKILVGHALKNDLRTLDIHHPWEATRDTAKYQPFMKIRYEDGILWPRKLKDLCEEKLQREIQVHGQAHCPVEDAIAALDLYKSVRAKFEGVMSYKIKKTQRILQEQEHL